MGSKKYFFFLPLSYHTSSPAALADISEMVLQLQGNMMKMENFQKLLELKKDLTGIDNLAVRGRVRLFIMSAVLFISFLFKVMNPASTD